MPKYMILLHDSPDAFANVSPEQMQGVLQKFMAWTEKLQASGAMLAGDKLADEPGKVMRGKPGAVRVTDGPYSEAKEVLGGFSVPEIARAFLVAEPTIAQRLVRAKRQLRTEGITFDLPSGPDLSARLESVLEVIYLLFNEG